MVSELNKLVMTIPDSSRRAAVDKEFEGFQQLFRRYLEQSSDEIQWSKIKLPPPEALRLYEEIETNAASDHSSNAKDLLNKLVVVKLNGGLGTSMGCTGPKSTISVRNELTFLDITVQQIESINNKYGCSVPLVLMNSFNTQEDTEKILQKYLQVNVQVHTFMQSRYPRIVRESLLPMSRSYSFEGQDQEAWYPPGHGDVYRSLRNSGLLEKFLKEGKEWLFISNIDNLGASVDINILHYLETSGKEGGKSGESRQPHEFLMEVTDKTRADVKGGTLIEYEGHLRLLEIAQVPRDHVDEFTSIRKFKIFNTNNLWVNLSAVDRVLTENCLHMEVIVNPKHLDTGAHILQLEEAAGAAIKSFEAPQGLVVPRRRFLPVKTTSDLLVVMSNLYQLSMGTLRMNALRSFPSAPLIKLGGHFQKVKAFASRFVNIPDLLELDHLTVSGDVTFGKNVVLKGTVIIIANHGDRIDIPSGAILENKIVSGNLRILDH